MREFFTIAIFKIKADIRMNKTTLNSQKEKHSTLSLRRAMSNSKVLVAVIELFLSTFSLRRATMDGTVLCFTAWHFYPRSPCGERHLWVLFIAESCISIHALLAESDSSLSVTLSSPFAFLSTLSLRRATESRQPSERPTRDFYPRSPCGERQCRHKKTPHFTSYFYPRSPCGERQWTP